MARWREELRSDARRLASALLVRRQSRSAVYGPPWRDAFELPSFGNRRYSAGNVRARIVVTDEEAHSTEAVRALVPWRRRRWPSQTRLLLYYGPQQEGPVANVDLLSDGRDTAVLLFDPREFGAGEYELYYLPHSARWEPYDARDDTHGVSYDASRDTYDPAWRARNGHRAGVLPTCRVVDIQARTHRDRYDAMERPATKVELARHLRAAAAMAAAFEEEHHGTGFPAAEAEVDVPPADLAVATEDFL